MLALNGHKKYYWIVACIIIVALIFLLVPEITILDFYNAPPTTVPTPTPTSHTFHIPKRNYVLFQEPTFPNTTHFYEFCDLKHIYTLYLATGFNLYLLAYEEEVYPNKYGFMVFMNGVNDTYNNIAGVTGHWKWKLEMSIYDQISSQFKQCEITPGYMSLVLHVQCDTNPNLWMKNDVEDIKIQVKSVEEIHEVTVPLCRRIQQPLYSVGTCLAFVHAVPHLEKRIIEHIEYHKMVGFEHFTYFFRDAFYQDYLSKIYGDQLQFRFWPMGSVKFVETTKVYLDQAIVISQCVAYYRRRSVFVAAYDLDEYLSVSVNSNDNITHMLNISLPERITNLAHENSSHYAWYFKRQEMGSSVYDESKLVIEQFQKTRVLDYGPKFVGRSWLIDAAFIHTCGVPAYLNMEPKYLEYDDLHWHHYEDLIARRSGEMEVLTDHSLQVYVPQLTSTVHKILEDNPPSLLYDISVALKS